MPLARRRMSRGKNEMTKSADAYDSANFICLHLSVERRWGSLNFTEISSFTEPSQSTHTMSSSLCMGCRRLPIQLRGRLLSSWMSKDGRLKQCGLAVYPVWINLLLSWHPERKVSAISEFSASDWELHSKNYDLETLIIRSHCFPTNSISHRNLFSCTLEWIGKASLCISARRWGISISFMIRETIRSWLGRLEGSDDENNFSIPLCFASIRRQSFA